MNAIRGHGENDSVLKELTELNFPKGSYMVMGSGVLDVLGIRKAADVDLVVSNELYNQLKELGWQERTASNGTTGIEQGVVQAYNKWTDEVRVKTFEELIVDATWIDGVAYNSLEKLYRYKVNRGLDKDLKDLILIDEFRSKQQ
jgi:hypothetical protein